MGQEQAAGSKAATAGSRRRTENRIQEPILANCARVGHPQNQLTNADSGGGREKRRDPAKAAKSESVKEKGGVLHGAEPATISEGGGGGGLRHRGRRGGSGACGTIARKGRNCTDSKSPARYGAGTDSDDAAPRRPVPSRSEDALGNSRRGRGWEISANARAGDDGRPASK